MGNQLNKSEKVIIRLHFEDEETIIGKTASMLKKNPEYLNKTLNLTEDTLLHYAVYHRKAKLVRFLLDYGADRNARNVFGLRPVDLLPQSAEEGGETGCVQHLREMLRMS